MGPQDSTASQARALKGSAIARLASWTRRHTLWAAIAAALLTLGAIGSLVAARTVARADQASAQRQVRSNTAQMVARLDNAIEQEQDLIIGARAFVITNPNATEQQFKVWVASDYAFARYPELVGIGHSVIVPAARLKAFAARAITGGPGSLSANGMLRVSPAGTRPFYCLAVGSQTRPGHAAFAPGYDYCAPGNPIGAASLMSRDSGQPAYVPIRSGKTQLLSITDPIYRMPTSAAGHDRRFVGWIEMSLSPDLVLARAQRGRATPVVFEYKVGPWDAVYRSGRAPIGARATTTTLGDGWTLKTFAVVTGATIFARANSWALLLGGVVVSLLIAILVFVLGTSRVRAMGLVLERTGELRHQALHDGLTGLANRVLIMDRIDQLLARNRRVGTEGAALFIDLDEFKNVNDTLGHGAGDELLIAVAARLKSTLRDADTIGRMGGDEFVVLIDGSERQVAPYLVAERLLEAMREPVDVNGNAITVHTSIGIAVGDRNSAGELLRDADVALYEAKARGKNGYQVFLPEMQVAITDRVKLEADLRLALAQEQFFLVYQPVYNLEDLTVIGVEALLRWRHPVYGLVEPGKFVPALEQTGGIREVGRWVLNEACMQMVAWRSRGDSLDLSVNVSSVQLDRPAIVDDIREALQASGLEPSSLIIEVTETALMRDDHATALQLRAIKALGVRIAVDDFGTGYSSLSYLRQFPVDSLKIDRSLTKAINASPESSALIGTLLQLGKDLGLSTLAEGVETPGQLDHLRAKEVDEIQGFLLSEPLSAEKLESEILEPTRSTTPVSGD